MPTYRTPERRRTAGVIVHDQTGPKDVRSEATSAQQRQLVVLAGGGASLVPLDVLGEQARAYVDQAHAPNTRRAYRADWLAFDGWCRARGLDPLPALSTT